MALDLNLLEKVRHHACGKVTARCPACAESGGDRTGNHLAIFPSEAYACAACPDDGGHRKRIFALAGIRSEFQPEPAERRQHRRRRALDQRRKLEADQLAAKARKHRLLLVERFEWEPADVWDDSPQRIDGPLVETDPRHFLASLFSPEALLWTGSTYDSGKPSKAKHWRRCSEWQDAEDGIGPMTTPATWKPGTISRSADQVATAPFTVLDFDEIDGKKPEGAGERERLILDSLAIIRWLREDHHWQLAGILHTGGKSLHAWFHTPPPHVLQSLRDTASAFGVDAGLIGRPEHPCRLPGQRHDGTGDLSRVLWLQTPVTPVR